MFKVELLRVIKTPINWIFSVVFPIALIIIFGLLLGREYLHYGVMGIILLISLTGTIIPISIYFCSDKVEKRIKHYLIIQGAIKRYTIALYLVNLIIFIFVSLMIFLITILLFKVNINYKAILMLLTFPIISYSLAFMIAIILGSLVTSINSIIPFFNAIILCIFVFIRFSYSIAKFNGRKSKFLLYRSINSFWMFIYVLQSCCWINRIIYNKITNCWICNFGLNSDFKLFFASFIKNIQKISKFTYLKGKYINKLNKWWKIYTLSHINLNRELLR